MDLGVSYLGLKLRNPLVMSASPLTEKIENFQKLEDAGFSAVVMHSLFEEQIVREERTLEADLQQGTESYPESLTYFPREEFLLGPEDYLRQIEKAKKAVQIPVIASLNGSSAGGWMKYAKNFEDAGADAVELNIYYVLTDGKVSSKQVEQVCLDIVGLVKSRINIPLAVKLSPYYSAPVEFAKRLDQAGVDGLVLFNRFYQPDFDLEEKEVVPSLNLSTSTEMRLPLRWIAILYGNIRPSLAATTGVHTAEDVIKMVMAGADVAYVCSVILEKGIDHGTRILEGVESWLKAHDYEALRDIQGILSFRSPAASDALERANYIKTLHSYRR